MSTASLIITSIASPNEAMKAFAEGCLKNGMEFIVIGDRKSPADFKLDGCRFLGLEDQKNLPFKIARHLPENSYSRKNIGYLLSKGKDLIIETDDDNLPRDAFWKKTFSDSGVRYVHYKGWVNTYRFFTDENIWPRGFPIEKILTDDQPKDLHSDSIPILETKPWESVILQGLADQNPDVDAVYRMTSKLPVSFNKGLPVLLGESSWCPFNSQNTTWKKIAFPLLYLPSCCSFRMTDIWRSFIAQRIAWTCGWSILFHSADVWQERNEHNLLKDFADEVPGYLNNARICETLEDLELKTGVEHIRENLLRCYRVMIEKGWVGKEEAGLVELWCEEFDA